MTSPARLIVSVVTVAAATLIASAELAATAAAPASREMHATFPADGLTHLDLTSLDGRVDISADPSPTASIVTVSVAVDRETPQFGHRAHPVDLDAVALDAAPDRNILRVGLKNAEAGNVEAVWTITVPSRFSATVNAHDAAVRISGLAGGIDAHVNAGLRGRGGTLDVDVPRGRLALTMGVGDIAATRSAPDFASATVRATVGDAELFLLGHEIDAPHEPGPGHHIALDGKGPDTLSLKVSVGHVSLKIG